MVDRYLNLYNATFPEWSTIPDLASYLDFTDLLTKPIKTYMLEKGIGELYINDFVEGIVFLIPYTTAFSSLSEAYTRVNYAQVRPVPIIQNCTTLLKRSL